MCVLCFPAGAVQYKNQKLWKKLWKSFVMATSSVEINIILSQTFSNENVWGFPQKRPGEDSPLKVAIHYSFYCVLWFEGNPRVKNNDFIFRCDVTIAM